MLEECAIAPEMLARLADPFYLPSRDEVLEAFQLELPLQEAWEPRGLANQHEDMRTLQRIQALPPSQRSFEENFKLSFGPMTFSALFSFCEDHRLFEVLTREYVEGLGDYLAERLAVIGTETPSLIDAFLRSATVKRLRAQAVRGSARPAALQGMEGARAHDARSDDPDDGVSGIGHPAAGPLLLAGNKTTEAAHISTSECLQLAPQQRRVHDLR